MEDLESPSPWPRRLRWAAGVVLAACLSLLLVNQLLLTVFVVEGVSMEPTLRPGQRVLVLRPCGEIGPRDLLVFKNPTAPEEVLLKRVLGRPGEEVHMEGYAPVRVEEAHFFLVGDNAAHSIDSRTFGAVSRRLVIGKVVFPEDL